MGIRFLCPNGHKLNVKAELAGRRGSCPECGAKLVIPAASATPQPAHKPVPQPAAVGPAAATVVGTLAPAWYFRSPSGEQHGPLNELQFRASIAAGRVTADTYLWREGWTEWRPARSVAELLPTPLVAKPVAAPLAAGVAQETVAAPPGEESTAAETVGEAIASLAPGAVADGSTAAADEIEVETEEDSTIDSAALATSKYVYQRQKNKQKQISLAVGMLIAVVILAAVLYFVINLNSAATTESPATTSIHHTTITADA